MVCSKTPKTLGFPGYWDFRDGLLYNGPPLHGASGKPKPRPALELLKAMSRTPLPHVKLCGRVVSMASVKSALTDCATLGPRAHLTAVQCPRKAVESPVKSTTYLPHVYTLVATRSKPKLSKAPNTPSKPATPRSTEPRVLSL